MIPIGIVLGLVAVLFGLSRALEMIVNARRNAAVMMVMSGEPGNGTAWFIPGKEKQ